jgi:tRNA G18 (ribose-2'-O)-methylase SpoU
VVIEMVAGEAACPACGVLTSRVKDRPFVAVKDLDACGQRVDLWWRKRCLVCLEPQCRKGTFTQASFEIPPRARLTNRLRARIATAIASGNRAVSEVAGEYGVSWPTAHTALVVPRWQPAEVLRRARVVLVADGIEYAGNLGAVLRTVDASGADALVVTDPVGRLTHPTVFSASRGTLLTTPTLIFDSVEEARQHLDLAGFEIVVADPDAGLDHRDLRYGDRPTAIVVGSEGSGVSAEWRGGDVRRVSIAMQGRADSLNVATAAAVLLFGASRSRDERGA